MSDPVDARRALEQALEPAKLSHQMHLALHDLTGVPMCRDVWEACGQRNLAQLLEKSLNLIALLSAATREETPACPKHARKLELYCADCDAEAERRGMLRQPPPRPETGETLATLRAWLVDESRNHEYYVGRGKPDDGHSIFTPFRVVIGKIDELLKAPPASPAPAERERRE